VHSGDERAKIVESAREGHARGNVPLDVTTVDVANRGRESRSRIEVAKMVATVGCYGKKVQS